MGYNDVAGAKTTLLGAFLTSPSKKTQTFTPGTARSVRNYVDAIPEGAIKLQLHGVHSTNYETDDDKHFHTSPYKSSWGCPSTGKENADIIKEMAANGPSLFMNYGPASYHPEDSISKCDAVPRSLVDPKRRTNLKRTVPPSEGRNR